MEKEGNKPRKGGKGGRPQEDDPAKHCVMVRFTDTEKELHSHFSEKKTLALLYKLENITHELVTLTKQIVQLSEEFKETFVIPNS